MSRQEHSQSLANGGNFSLNSVTNNVYYLELQYWITFANAFKDGRKLRLYQEL